MPRADRVTAATSAGIRAEIVLLALLGVKASHSVLAGPADNVALCCPRGEAGSLDPRAGAIAVIPAARRRRIEALAIAIIASCLFTSCSKSTQSPPGGGHASTRVLLRAVAAEPDSLDPQKAASVEAHTILRDLCEGLITLDRDGLPQPGAAQAWQLSEDGRTYTFSLRQHLRWDDGRPLVAEDFVNGLRRLADPQTASPYAQFDARIKNAAAVFAGTAPASALTVEAIDDHTVRIELETPEPYLPALLAHPSMCPARRDEETAGTVKRARVPHGNAAYRVQDWVPGAYVLLTRNPYYWSSGAKLQNVKYVFTSDAQTEFNLFRAGLLHITSTIPRSQLPLLRSDFAAALHVAPLLATYYYGFNLRRAPLGTNPALRKALSLAIDRDRLTKDVLQGLELPAQAWVPSGVAGYGPQASPESLWPIAQREAEAKRLLRAAGYGTTNVLRVVLSYNSGEIHRRLAVAIASMWHDVLGVETKLESVEFKTLLDDITRGDVEIFRSNWTGDFNDPMSFLNVFASDSGVNQVGYRNPAYDELLHKGFLSRDAASRRSTLESAERMLLADAVVIPLYFQVSKHLVAPKVRGWSENSLDIVYSKDLDLSP